jgi:hypothetical protein
MAGRGGFPLYEGFLGTAHFPSRVDVQFHGKDYVSRSRFVITRILFRYKQKFDMNSNRWRVYHSIGAQIFVYPSR